MTVAVGSRLGPYEILAPLGAGGRGEVYRARDTRLARAVALNDYDVTAEGQRFLIGTLVGEANRSPVNVILNWAAGLKR
jgi:serine/threonine protein kinase